MYLISPAHPAQVEWIGAGLTGLEIETWLYRFANVIIHIWVLKIPYCRLFCNSFLSRWTMRFMTVTSICHPLWLGRVHIYAFFLTASPTLAVLLGFNNEYVPLWLGQVHIYAFFLTATTTLAVFLGCDIMNMFPFDSDESTSTPSFWLRALFLRSW